MELRQLSPIALCGLTLVVVLAPRFDLRPGVVKVQEPMLVEAFDTSTGIEALDESVIGGFTWTVKIQDDAICIRP